MPRASASRELRRLATDAGRILADLRDVPLTAAWPALLPLDERAAIVDDVISPASAAPASGRRRA